MPRLLCLLEDHQSVVLALLTYTDWYQPSTASVMQVGGRRTRGGSDGLPPALLGMFDVRAELRSRMRSLSERERGVLVLWYVRQLSVDDIARELGISRRHCFRLRSRAISRLVELSDPGRAA